MGIRLSTRTRLLGIVVPPLLGLIALAAIGVVDRTDDQRAAEVRAGRLDALTRVSTLTNALQMEAISSTSTIEGADLSDRRARTDGSFQEAIASISALSNAESSLPALDSRRILESVGLVQADIQRARKIDAVDLTQRNEQAATYNDTIETLIVYESLISAGLSADGSVWSRLEQANQSELEIFLAALNYGATLPFDPAAQNRIAVLHEAAQAGYDGFRFSVDRELNEDLDELMSRSTVREGSALIKELVSTTPPAVTGAKASELAVSAESRTREISARVAQAFGALEEQANAELATAERQSQLFMFGAGAGVVIVALLTLVFASSITRALKRLTRSSTEIANEQVPAMVDAIQSGHQVGRIQVDGADRRDEFGDVARSLNAVGGAIVEVASRQQEALKKGIGDIFVNLARRNQTLLDRQIELIDRLEAHEQDPDQLDHLFKLDHLATRMRRNAESLLVLAEAETPRRRGHEVSLSDVVRVAVGEIEDFPRIRVTAIEQASIHGGAAVDLAHLLSELLENGTQYSPPDRFVEVSGSWTPELGYLIEVLDQGVGMTEDQLVAMNRILAEPPRLGFGINRSLGLIVASKLAQRHQIRARLERRPNGGIRAVILLAPVLMHRDATTLEIAGLDPQQPVATIEAPGKLDPGAARSPEWVDRSAIAAPPLGHETTPTPVIASEPGEHAATAFVAAPIPPAPPVAPPTSTVQPAAFTPPAPKTTPPVADPMAAGFGAFAEEVMSPMPPPETLEEALGSPRTAPSENPPPPQAEQIPAHAGADPLHFTEDNHASEVAGTSASGLPMRKRTTVSQAQDDEPTDKVGAPVRDANEVRSLLSRYRGGLRTGRAVSSPSEKTEEH